MSIPAEEEHFGYYWLTTTPTITDVRQLVRGTLWCWPCDLMSTLLDAGVNIDTEAGAVMKQVVAETSECIGLQIHVRLNGKLIAVLTAGSQPDGKPAFSVYAKRKH